MVNTPKVSVLIPVYNTEAYIAQTIESVLAQTYQDWELVIVDDCSTDQTFDICRKYTADEPRIRLYKNEKNLGMMPNWNYGITLCRGEYWGKLDADDLWHENMIEECVKILDQSPEVGLVCTSHVIIDEQGVLQPETVAQSIPEFARNKSFSCIDLVKQGPDQFLSFPIMKQGIGLLRRSFFKKYESFKLDRWGDTEMWFRIGAHFQIFYQDKVYHFHRKWSQNFTAQTYQDLDKINAGFYETRKAILDYYYNYGKISNKEFQTFSRKNLLNYQVYLIYKLRTERKYLSAFAKFLYTCCIAPKDTITFYTQRLFKR
ncbi:MAG: glycosyltransferase family 2 protein [Microscillaceae bacterium]|nr:glycosyltransferase family 2 protein [Microscillaceae bacterium]